MNNYITRIDSTKPIGKIFAIDAQGNLTKNTIKSSGTMSARTYCCNNVGELHTLLLDVSKNPCSAIVLGYVPTFVPDKDLFYGDAFTIVSIKDFRAMFNTMDISKPINGVTVRSAKSFKQSDWACFDFDVHDDTPQGVVDAVEEHGYHHALTTMYPELVDVSYLGVGSSSSRVYHNDVPVSRSNQHIYVLTKDGGADFKAKKMASAMNLLTQDESRPESHQFGYTIESPTARTYASIIDLSVFSQARIMYEGAPSIQGDGITLHPSFFDLSVRKKNRVSCNKVPEISNSVMLKTKLSMATTSHGIPRNTTDLTAETQLVYHDDITGEEGVMTMLDFVNSDRFDRLRVQNPFKPSSTSMSAFVSKTDDEGKPIHPILVSNEFGTYTYVEPCEEIFTPIPNTPDTPDTPGTPVTSPFPSLSTNLSTPQVPVDAPIPQIPATLSTPKPQVNVRYPLLHGLGLTENDIKFPAKGMSEVAGSNYLRELLCFKNEYVFMHGTSSHNVSLYQWTGQGYERGGSKGDLAQVIASTDDSLSGSKVYALTRLLTDSLYKDDKLLENASLPSNIIALQNGLFNAVTGEIAPHNPDYIYFVDDVKPFSWAIYDEHTTCDFSDMLNLVASKTANPELWLSRCWELMAYLVMGSWTNHEQVAVWFMGGSASGKSTIMSVLSALAKSTKQFKLSKLHSNKVLASFRETSFVYDDDASTNLGRETSEIVSTLKSLVGSPTGLSYEQLYKDGTNSMGRAVKTAIISNDIINFGHEEITSIVRRLACLSFPTGALLESSDSNTNYTDVTQQSIVFHKLWTAYTRLLAQSGIPSPEDYETNTTSYKLSFTKEPESLKTVRLTMGASSTGAMLVQKYGKPVSGMSLDAQTMSNRLVPLAHNIRPLVYFTSGSGNIAILMQEVAQVCYYLHKLTDDERFANVTYTNNTLYGIDFIPESVSSVF